VTSVTENDAEKQIIDWLRSVKKRGPQDIPIIILFNKIDKVDERKIDSKKISEITETLKGKVCKMAKKLFYFHFVKIK
jgi:GTP-binding protein EngB required for normal cell division